MQLYRRVIMLLSQALFVMLVLASCIMDKFEDDLTTGQKTPRKEAYAVSFRIQMPAEAAGTRADDKVKDIEDAGSGDFVHGDEEEHLRNGCYAFFFNGEKQLLTISPLNLQKYGKGEHEGYIEISYVAKFTMEDPEDLEEALLPKSCLLLLNGQNIYNQLNLDVVAKSVEETGPTSTYMLATILSKVWENSDPTKIGFDGENDAYFTMTNSVYVDDNDVLQTAVEIPEGAIKKEGEYPTEDEILEVHVERMVAKFTFGATNNKRVFQPSNVANIVFFSGIDELGHPKYIAKKWQVEVTGWGINALETQNHLFKNISEAGDYFPNWSDATHFRSYWSEDPHYTGINYSSFGFKILSIS